MKIICYLPNTIAIGPQRCGTTWLQNYFKERKDILLPKGTKETHYFDIYYSNGLDWYRSFFKNAKSFSRVVEIAPTYFEKTEVPERIYEDLGNITIICTLRNPMIRAFSLYLHLLRFGFTHVSFRTTVDKNTLILNSSLYAVHLRHWINIFGKKNILIVFFEELQENPNNYINAICAHLNIPFIPVNANTNKKIGEAALPSHYRIASVAQRFTELLHKYRLYPLLAFGKRIGLRELFFGSPVNTMLPELSKEDYNWFLQKVKHDIDDLEKLLNIDLHEWKNQKS